MSMFPTPPRQEPSDRSRRDPHDCPCGESHENFLYIRGMLSGARSKGFWYCPACQSRRSPNTIQGILSAEEKERLATLKTYYSNEGMGDMHKHEEVVACLLPGAVLTYTPAAP